MRIAYVTLDTELWGGICVVFQHLELLAEGGHEVLLATTTSHPDWYQLKTPLRQLKSLDPELIPEADIIVATSWMTVKPVVESKKGIPVHLCQGYEADCTELKHLKEDIDRAYSYDIPKLIVSPHLKGFLEERFHAETHYIGQVLNRDIFYPVANRVPGVSRNAFTILVVGPFEVDLKNIPLTLRGIALAKKRLPFPVRLIRVSQFPISKEEEAILKPDEYHFHVPYSEMGDLYRRADLLLSLSKEGEGFGLPALEAMASGVPTILSKIPSYRGFAEPSDYAFFMDPEGPDAVSDVIVELAKNTRRRETLIHRGLQVAATFNRENVLLRLNSAFEEILRKDKLARVKQSWDSYHKNKSETVSRYWWDMPLIMSHCQKLVTGDPSMTFYQFLKKEFVPHTLGAGLSICSGSGDFERGLIDHAICNTIDAYEVAEERANEGVRIAREKNYAINFHIEDVNRAVFPRDHYDIFFSWAALHHIDNLEGVCLNVREGLKKGGLLIVQEYIGPNQFQWTDKQVEVVNSILSILPDHLRTNVMTGEIKRRISRPTIEEMNESDPSEAIRSQEIVSVLEKFFRIRTIKYFGGSLFNILFNDIVGNFDINNQKDAALIEMILLLEKYLIENKVLENDYAVIIAEKK